MIFNNKVSKPEIVASKAKAYLMETVLNFQIDEIKLEAKYKWLSSLKVEKIQVGPRRPVIKPFWQIRTPKKEFTKWWQMKNKVSIFFDGALKGNQGKAGAGGLIFYPGGNLETSFKWGVGQTTNNQAELYALLKSCQLTKATGHGNIQIFGDSEIISKVLNFDSMFNKLSLNVTM